MRIVHIIPLVGAVTLAACSQPGSEFNLSVGAPGSVVSPPLWQE